LRTFLLRAALIVGITILAAEGYFVYWFYTNPETFPTAAVSYEVAPDANGREKKTADNTGEAKNPTSKGAATSAEAVFVHEATPENILENITYVDHPVANDDPDAVLHVTQSWNSEGGGETYNEHPIAVWYDPDAGRWSIVNLDFAAIPEGADFNVLAFRDAT